MSRDPKTVEVDRVEIVAIPDTAFDGLPSYNAPQMNASLGETWNALLQRIQNTPPLRLLWVCTLVVLLLTGSAMQIICLNFWLRQYNVPTCDDASSSSVPRSEHSSSSAPCATRVAGSYTTLLVSSAIFCLFFLIALAIYIFTARPNLRFATQWSSLRLLMLIAFLDVLNSALAIYAANHTPEILQALFTSLVPIYAAGMTKMWLRDPRNYNTAWVRWSFSLMACGVLLASVCTLLISNKASGDESAQPHRNSGKGRMVWCLIFALSVPCTVLMNVGQTLYMARFTYDAELADMIDLGEGSDDYVVEEASEVGNGVGQATHSNIAPETPVDEAQEWGSHNRGSPTSAWSFYGDDTSVKLVMLAGGTSLQCVFAMVLFPMDSLPFFGENDSIGASMSNLSAGLECLIHCPHNFLFGFLYSMGFVLVYISAAYLNQYSVTLCSMVSQLGGPITALVLILAPRLNVSGEVTTWYGSLLSVLMLMAGTAMYVLWEEKTEGEKTAGELDLKYELFVQDHGGLTAPPTNGTEREEVADFITVEETQSA